MFLQQLLLGVFLQTLLLGELVFYVLKELVYFKSLRSISTKALIGAFVEAKILERKGVVQMVNWWETTTFTKVRKQVL